MGLEFALLGYYYGFLPWDVSQFTRDQIDMYLHHLPDVAYRATYGVARLTAAVKNLAGGKPDPAEGDKPVDPTKQFSPEEELPWFARPPAETRSDPELAKAIIASRAKLPRWARPLLNWQALEKEALTGLR